MRKEKGHCVRGLTFEALKEIWKSVVVTAFPPGLTCMKVVSR